MRVSLVVLGIVGCAATPTHRVPVTLVVDGNATIEPHAVAGLELQRHAVPMPAPPTSDESVAIVAKARAAYADGNFDACRNELARVELGKLLAVGQRALAARAIAFDAACAVGAEAATQAELLAMKLAIMGLDPPDARFDSAAETILVRAIAKVGQAPRHALTVKGSGRLAVDGKPAGCTLPCTVDVAAGDHFVGVEADGFMPFTQWVRVDGPTALDAALLPATPEVAVAQWRARIGNGMPATDAVGAMLLARFTGQSRIVALQGDRRVTAVAISGGEIRARGEGEPVPVVRELAYDAGFLKRPALWQQPRFWIVTSIAVAIVAGIVVYAVYEPDVESNLRF